MSLHDLRSLADRLLGYDHMCPTEYCAVSDIAGADDGDDLSGWIGSFRNPVLGVVTGFGEWLL